MKATKVKIYGGIAQAIREIKGRTYSFTGAWNLIIEDDEGRYFTIECLVPGEADSLAGLSGIMGDWSKNEYAIELEAYSNDGDLIVDQAMAQELKEVLEQVKRGEIKPVNVYGIEVSNDYVRKVLDFIMPRLEYVPQNLDGGIATRRDIEISMGGTDIPPLPRA